MLRLFEAPPPPAMLRHARQTPDFILVPAWKTGAVIDIFANAELRWLCRPGARTGAPVVRP